VNETARAATDLRVEPPGARVRVTGEGPPLVLLHGNPDTAEMWDPVAGRLADVRRCIAPDLPGFGGSDMPRGFDFSLEAMADWVQGVISGLGVQGAVDLAVHDFGGPYGLAWAVRYPHRVRRVIVSNTIFFANYRWHPWARVWRTPLLGEVSMLLMNRWVFRRELRKGGPGLPREHMDAAWARLRWRTRRAVLALYRATDPGNFAGWEEALLELCEERPFLVLWGQRDPYIGSEFARRFGSARVRMFPETGHWAALEAPDEWSGETRSFLGDAAALQASGDP
jgi:pimeloyl-ACP methyl ester carboxylesterase